MNRRVFASSLAAGILFPRLRQTVGEVSTPVSSSRPAPQDLGDGIVLIDFRLHPGDRPAIIGEIRNDLDHMVDAPVISLNWDHGPEHARFAWASPIIPVIQPGGSVPIFGELPEVDDIAAGLESARFALCSTVEAGPFTALEQALDLDLHVSYERYRPVAFKGTGTVTNLSSRPSGQVSVYGVVRDGDRRIAGVAPTTFWYNIPAGDSREFAVWMATNLTYKGNPVPLISGLDYSVDVTAGTRGHTVAPACVFGKPWE